MYREDHAELVLMRCLELLRRTREKFRRLECAQLYWLEGTDADKDR